MWWSCCPTRLDARCDRDLGGGDPGQRDASRRRSISKTGSARTLARSSSTASTPDSTISTPTPTTRLPLPASPFPWPRRRHASRRCFRRRREEMQAEQTARLARALPLPQLGLPQLLTGEIGVPEIDLLVDALETGFSSASRPAWARRLDGPGRIGGRQPSVADGPPPTRAHYRDRPAPAYPAIAGSLSAAGRGVLVRPPPRQPSRSRASARAGGPVSSPSTRPDGWPTLLDWTR